MLIIFTDIVNSEQDGPTPNDMAEWYDWAQIRIMRYGTMYKHFQTSR